MLYSVIHNARRRGVLGAFLGALAPYAFWAYENGVALAVDSNLIVFVCMVSAFFAVLGYGIFHGGFGRKSVFPSMKKTGIDLEEMDQTNQSGQFAWMRDVRSRHR
ncbi:hypothetical protein [Loktanella sp. Alg231-35]|uniref:hypothetical protein n=1 Tax=Loktanella sp. Alg231-35 TaxID=1922220 RepID=UPI000D54AF3F|nr:hypothetical protein [Loktanella sp. Alg231-35]